MTDPSDRCARCGHREEVHTAFSCQDYACLGFIKERALQKAIAEPKLADVIMMPKPEPEPTNVSLEICDQGHKFAKLDPNHRCPVCLTTKVRELEEKIKVLMEYRW